VSPQPVPLPGRPEAGTGLVVDAGDGDVVACAVGRPVWLVQPARRTTSATVIAGRDTAFIPSSSPVPGYLAMADPASSASARW